MTSNQKGAKVTMKMWILISLAASLVFSISITNNVSAARVVTGNKTPKSKTYHIDATKWGIYSDGTHPVETTKGINDAIVWATSNGYKTVYLPSGTYSISKDSKINLLSNMTFKMDSNTVLKEETNNYDGYNMLYAGRGVHNLTIQGGDLEGDRSTHDFLHGGTQESGYGINLQGVHNVTIDRVKSENFTGDGLMIGASSVAVGGLDGNDFESGSIDDNGNFVNSPNSIRVKSSSKVLLTNSAFQDNPFIELDHTRQMNVPFDAFFYTSDGTFISSAKHNEFGSRHDVAIPKNANYCYIVLHNTSSVPDGIKAEVWNKLTSTKVTVQNSEFALNRRQGISIVGANGVVIQNNHIHDQNGTAPQSGIDSEGGGFVPNDNISILNNKIYDNKGLDVVLADGDKFNISGNYFGYINRPASIGLAIDPSADHSTVTNNTFDKGGFQSWKDTIFSNNTVNMAKATFSGPNIQISNDTFNDSYLGLTGTVPNGIQVSDVTMYETKGVESSFRGIGVYGKKMTLRNIKLYGNQEISGTGNDQNIYNNVKILGTFNRANTDHDYTFAPGIYTNASITERDVEIKYPGKTLFNKSKFTDTKFYTYNNDSDLTIENSSFNFSKPDDDNVIVTLQAKNLSLFNNTFAVNRLTSKAAPIIQIGRDAWAGHPTENFGATISGNTFTTNLHESAVDTTNGGNPYYIANNTLKNCYLVLMKKDINKNNNYAK